MIYDEIAMNNGVIFQRAVDILNAQMKVGLANMSTANGIMSGALDTALIVPIAVNAAFASELYMKSMLPKNTKGHKLDALFNLLDSNLQIEIMNLTVDKMRKINAEYCDTNFQSELNHNSNIFAEWRYFHEGNANSANFQFILSLMKSIFEVVNKERKNKI